jgi:DNA-binding response OmpR family regulator
MPDTGRPRVLVVEDEPAMNNLLADILSAFDFEPVQALDGPQALVLVGEDPPDAVILDLMLPGISGYEVCRRLKTARQTRGIPVLILTALDRQSERRAAFQTGADDYMTKPFAPDALIERLRACIAAAGRAAGETGPLRLTAEPTGVLGDVKVLNTFITTVYQRTDLPPPKIEALRQHVASLLEAAGAWAADHAGRAPVRVVMTLDADRVRLTFEPLAEGAEAFLAEHLDADAVVPSALVDAGAIDRAVPQGGGVMMEKVLRPQEED